ncbi:N-acyl-D-amino-acid deacylase family protein [Yinghuangia seranimata]|uniref:N-acyl-D-amino-acid deacylase family protein n=1 Tax=Yinghuangia seranimata TaxID=408067 RepID=UPI00248AB9A5|nr:amidohydrolase family protein [Yinghuangia seranimata]MDI2132535.1 amidohydrolase family protein [Yinghuangia seranimata]
MDTRYDLKITNATIVDGTGADRFTGDIAVKDGLIVAVHRHDDGGAGIEGDAAETIDAAGRLVTPGFVDIHTHYDGQATWDELLDPSTSHGVTTIVSGNCGVGFAPVRPGAEDWLIGLMEGVEDIPGTALAEGMTWGWETFPEYLDVLEQRHFAADIGVQIAHGAVRAYAMGDRGARNEPATAEDIEAMAVIVKEAVEAGALGFSTSRTVMHRAMGGEPVPGTFAAEDELFGLGRAMAAGGRAVFELAPTGASGEDIVAPRTEVEWMKRLAEEIGMPVSFALLQVMAAPELWRELMAESMKAIEAGIPLYPQVAGRPFGMLTGFTTRNAFSKRPTLLALNERHAAGELDDAAYAAALADPAVREAVLTEEDLPSDASIPGDSVNLALQRLVGMMYPMAAVPDYEPTADRTVTAIAAERGQDVFATLYDLMLEDDAKAMLTVPLFNYANGDHEAIREMLTHPASVFGLADGGAHCAMICDASQPTYLLTHWARDRARGERLPLEFVIKKQTADTAELYGLGDRGVIEPGKRADLNVIDLDELTLHRPRMVHDLPAGGGRMLQDATGYVATVVAGQITRRNGQDTGARPGRLVRGAR